RVEASGLSPRDLVPRRDGWRRHVRPRLSAVGAKMNQTVIGAAPDSIHLERRRRDGVNDAAPVDLAGRIVFVFSNARRQLVLRSRQIGADLFPMIAAVARLPECISGEEHE